MSDRDFSRDGEDHVEATRMPLGEHIHELRGHLWRALGGFGAIVVLCFLLDLVGFLTGTPVGVGKPVMDWIRLPVEQELQKFHERRFERLVRDLEAGEPKLRDADRARTVVLELDVYQVARAVAPLLRVEPPPVEGEGRYRPFSARIGPVSWWLLLEQARVLTERRSRLVTMSATEAMTVYFKVTLACGLVLASPWVFFQIWSFVAAGLYPHEKRYVNRFLPLGVALFLAGVLLCQFLVVPRAVEALLGFNEWLELEPELRLSEWLSFALLMPLVFGAAFQTPLVMFLLERVGIFTAAAYRSSRRAAWFALAVFAAVITPSVDVYSMFFLWVPMGVLYELGIWLCVLAPRRPADFEEEAPVEV